MFHSMRGSCTGRKRLLRPQLCKEAAEKERGRLKLARLDVAALFPLTLPGLNVIQFIFPQSRGACRGRAALTSLPPSRGCPLTSWHPARAIGAGVGWGLIFDICPSQTIPIMLTVSPRVCGEHAWNFLLRFPPAWQGAGLAPKPTNFCAAIKKYLCNSWERFRSHQLGFAKPKIDLGLLF